MSIILVVASLITLVDLLIVYTNKMKIIKDNRNIFYILIYTCLIVFLIRILQYPVLLYINNKIIQTIYIKFSWILNIFSIWVLYLYYVYHANNLDKESFWEIVNINTNSKIISILNVIFIICVIYQPINNFNITNFIYPGNLLLYYYIVLGTNLIIINIGFLLKWKKIEKRKRTTLFIINIFLFTLSLIQYYIPQISILEFLLTIALYIFYFNVENPDLKIIEEKINTKNIYEVNNKILSSSLSLFQEQMNPYINNIYENYQKLDTTNDNKEFLNNITTNSQYLYDINTYLSNLSLCNNKNIYCAITYNTYELIKRLNEYAKKRINNDDIKFELKIDKNIPILLVGDYDKIYYIITSLINISILNTEIGKIILNINCKTNSNITILNIDIEDTGNGITKKQLETFNSKETKIIDNDYNSYLIKKYIEILKGNINVSTMELAGNKFHLNIAQNIANKTPLSAYSINFEKEIQYTNYENKKIAFVNDNKKDTMIFENTLNKYNANIDNSSTLKDLINKIKLGIRYDIIFIDKNSINDKDLKLIPVLNYLSITVPPIIYIDSNINDFEKQSILNDGINDIIYIPYDKIIINDLLLKYLSN